MTRTRRVGGIDTFTAARIGLDLAREHGMMTGTVALDDALHNRRTDLMAIHAELELMARWPGRARACAAVMAVDGRSESVLETRSRLAFVPHRVPMPVPQVSLGNPWGGFVGRPDFYWDEFGVAGEVDGALKYRGTAPGALLKEKRRQELLEDLGVIFVRWDRAGVDRFDLTAQRLFRAFARGATTAAADRRWTVLPTLPT